MSETLTTNPLAENLRLAASLVERIGWERPITWTGTGKLHLHTEDELELSALRGQLDHLGLSAERSAQPIQRSDGSTFTAQDFHGADGHFGDLTVTVFGPVTAAEAE